MSWMIWNFVRSHEILPQTVSAFYFKKQKSFIPISLGRCQYQNKKALCTDPIFSEVFGQRSLTRLQQTSFHTCFFWFNPSNCGTISRGQWKGVTGHVETSIHNSFPTICKNPLHGLRTPREEIAFTARPKIQSQSQISRYGGSIFCLPHRPNFSDVFDLCHYWLSVVRAYAHAPLF